MHNRTAFHVLVGRGGQLWNSAASVDGGDRVGPVPPGSQLQRTTSRVVALGALLLNSVVVDGRRVAFLPQVRVEEPPQGPWGSSAGDKWKWFPQLADRVQERVLLSLWRQEASS